MGLSSPSDKERFRWQFLGGCEWACLSPWVSILSEDGLYWKCEKREMVQNILMSKYWDTKFADDSAEWVDEKRGSAALMQTSSALLVATLAFVALLVCVVGSTFARECCSSRPLMRKVSSAIVACDVRSIRGRRRRGRATLVHVNMYDNDAGAMTSRALGRPFSGACAGCLCSSWTSKA
jgi:hypothetical protein